MILGSNGLWMGAPAGGSKGMFVGVTTGSRCTTSADGISWDVHSMAANAEGIVHVDGIFVACGSGGFQTSPNLVDWTARAGAISNSMSCITYGDGVFVSASRHDSVQKSNDGIVWSLQSTVSGTQNLTGAAYGSGKYVLTGAASAVLVSSDTSAWTSVATTPAGAGARVRYLNGRFIRVGAAGRVWVSENASTWTGIQTTSTDAINDVTYHDGLYVAVCAYRGSSTYITSPDAVSWTVGPEGVFAENASSIAVSPDGVFVVGCNYGWIYRSEDGVNWTGARPIDGNPSIRALIYVEGI